MCRRPVSFSLISAILLIAFLISSTYATIFSKSLKTCNEQCIDRNLVVPLNRGSLDWDEPFIAANLSSRINACRIGCQDLESVNSTCAARCNSLIAPDSCQQGCRAIADILLHHIQDLLYHVSLSIDGEDSQGISTVWKFDDPYGAMVAEISADHIRWAVQSRSSGSEAPWHVTVLEDKAFKDDTRQYKTVIPSEFANEIEVRLCVSWRSNVIVSRTVRQSIIGIGGRPHAPKLIAQLQISSNSYVICWNSPLPRLYKVSLYSLDGKQISSDETTNQCYLFTNIPTENCCRANIGYATFTEPSIDVAVKLELANTNEVTLESPPQLVFTNGTAIMKLYDVDDYVVLTDPKTIAYDPGPGRTITALCSISTDHILVALDDGSIFSVSVLDSKSLLIRQPDGVAITHMDIDHMQEKVYAVLHKKGIVRCDLTSCDNSTTVTTNSINFIEYISIDSWNGFIYCVMNGGESLAAPLFPLDAPSIMSLPNTQQISEVGPSFAIEVDSKNSQLIFISQNGSILSMNTITGTMADLRASYELSDQYKDVMKAHFAKNRLFWTSSSCGDSHPWDSCLYSEEWDTKKEKIHLNRYLYAGRVVDFTLLRNGTLPPTLLPPHTINLMTTDNSALVTWEPPISMPFQASGTEWRNLRYECRVINEEDEKSGKTELTHLYGTSLAVTVSPGLQYHATVRACVATVCSPFTSAINTALAPLNEQPFVLFNRTGETLHFFDILGSPLENYEISSALPAQPESPFAVDPTTESLYVVGIHEENTLYRLHKDGSKYLFLETSTIQWLALMPKYSVIVIASDYTILSYRLTSSFDQLIYSCDSLDNCGEVAGLAADDESGDVYFLIQHPNATKSLFGLNQDVRTPYLIASSTDFPPIRQLLVAGEKLAFITKTGQMGVCDKKLGSLNFNLVLNGVSLLVPSANVTPTNALNFSGDIAFEDDLRTNLTWSIDPAPRKGEIIYKISMYKEKFGDERFVDFSVEQSYTMNSELLDEWSSKQKFDVQIDAISAWNIVSRNRTGLFAPTKPPSSVRNLKIYATQQKTVDGARALIDLFWDEPTQWNGEPIGYIVNCSTDGTDELHSEELPPTVRTYSFSVKSGRISCIVGARNDPYLGTFSDPIDIDSSEIRPLVRLFAINSSSDVISVSNWSSTTTARSKRQNTPPSTITQQAIAFIGNELYSIRRDSDSPQPYLLHLDMINIENVLHKVPIGGEVNSVDAVISDWVANRLLFVSFGHLMQIGLDGIQGVSSVTPKRIMDLSPGAGDAKQLLYDPFTNTAYLLTKNGSLFSLDMTKRTEQNLALRLECLKSETVSSMMSEFAWNRAASPAIYVLTWNGMLRVDVTTMKCAEIAFDWTKFGENGLKSVSSFAIADKLFVFVTSAELIVYELSTSTATPIPVPGSPFKQVLAVSQSSQPYPDRSCFALSEPPDVKFTVQNEGKSGAVVMINEPPLPNSCPGVSVPATQYELHFKRKDSDKVKNVHSINHIVHVENGILDKETDYEVTVSWFNRFSSPSTPGVSQTLRTGYGFPSSPQEPSAFALSPDTVLLYWQLPSKTNAPVAEIKYRVSQLSGSLIAPATIGAQQFEGAHYSAQSTDAVTCLNDPCSAKISNLRPSTDYKFWVRAIHESHLNSQFSDDSEGLSTETTVRTKDVCGTLRPDNVTGTSVVLRWNSLEPGTPPTKISIQYRISGGDASWKSPHNATFNWSAMSTAIIISALRSATSYDYRFSAEYSGSYHYGNRNYPFNETYYQSAQQIKTKPGTPSAPTSVRLIQENDQWIVRWEKPLSDGGSSITSYAVEYRPTENTEWEIAERGIDDNSLWWKPPQTNFVSDEAEFRIRAANSEGFGTYAYSKPQSGSGSQTPSSIRVVIIGLLIAIVLLIAFIAALFIYYQRAEKVPKEKLREIDLKPMQNGSQHSVLPTQITNDLKSITRVEKKFINLSKMLGKGSFGEVYEGVACGLPQSPAKGVRVAIKTLKNGYSETDRLKFLKEAILMNNFDHPNIVKLMGVSLESEPYYLIIELMEGGDLLGFLRSSRPSDCLPSQLSLCELIDMMVDVGRGGSYLEANRHVHRDLAARNCLISSRNSHARVTKIADFGLARDVYTNDYYRVHGEDFLPLRWLAPESITDGVFTSKSDVWSFGVLLWEILTLGQQPYIGKQNVQVISFVKSGGRLDKPPYCPDEIFRIVERAWIYDYEERPRFADVLPELEALRGNPAYQDDTPFPPSCPSLTTTSNFDVSTDSNMSITGSADRSGSVRFDKSDNPSTKTQGRPSILRSLRKERPKQPPSREEIEAKAASSCSSRTANSVVSNETISTGLDSEYMLSGAGCGGIDNEGFISSDYYEAPTRRLKTNVANTKRRTLPPPINTGPSTPSATPPSSAQSRSSQDSSSIFVRPARVSRV